MRDAIARMKLERRIAALLFALLAAIYATAWIASDAPRDSAASSFFAPTGATP